MPRLKISGITNIEDAKWAAILGVEYISIVMDEESEKKISLSRATLIRDMLPSYTSFIAELGSLDTVKYKELAELKPGYIQFSNGELPASDAVGRISGELNDLIIFTPSDIYSEESLEDLEIKYIQLELPELPSEQEMHKLKDKYNMDNTIIQGDWPLADIKKACSFMQPFAWSVKTVFEKNPRKINYPLMKEYIREISLW